LLLGWKVIGGGMKKPFDCVEMKHNAARKIQKELKGKSIEEKLAYWNKEYQKQKKSICRE
jgi:hypothetical protein